MTKYTRKLLILMLLMPTILSARNKHFETDEARRTTNITTGGFGTWAINDGYLSSLQFQGWGIQIKNIRTRDMTEFIPNFRSNVIQGWEQQWEWQAHYGKGNNHAYTAMHRFGAEAGWGALSKWQFGKLGTGDKRDCYPKRCTGQLSLLIGPYINADYDGRYISRNVNRPYSMNATIALNAMGELRYDAMLSTKTRLTLGYRVFSPLGAVYFAPEQGQSYYEMEEVAKHKPWKLLQVGTVNRHYGVSQQLTLDIRFKRCAFRAAAEYDYYSTRAHGLRYQREQVIYSLGWIADLDILRGTKGYHAMEE